MQFQNLSISPFSIGDLEGVIDLLQRELYTDAFPVETFEQKVLLDPNFESEGALVAKLDGNIVGFMLGLVRRHPLEDAPPDLDRSWITLMVVDGKFQRHGIGTALIDRTMNYLSSRGAKSVWISPYAPNYFWPGVDESAYSGAINFLKKNRFEVAYRPLSMEVSLFDFEKPLWFEERKSSLISDGFTFDTFKTQYTLALTNFLRAEFPGDWQRIIRETMLDIFKGETASDQLFVAIKDDQCVGFCQHQSERFGPFGVSSALRGRGVGSVLLFDCLTRMKEKGFYRAWLRWTDDKAARLYSEAGFQETRRYSVMKCNLPKHEE